MPLVRPSSPPRVSQSTEQQEGRPPTFAPCPRSGFQTGITDWYQITTPRSFSDIDICSSCYDVTFRDTSYARCISKAPPKPTNLATRCDLSDRWNRAATFWLFTWNAPDLTLLGSVAEFLPVEDGACPNFTPHEPEAQNGSQPTATRTWYCLSDPTSGSLIEDLTVCSSCVGRVNLIFPSLHIFHPVADGQKLQATCDLLPAHDDGVRSEAYLSKFNETATRLQKTGTLDTRPLAEYVKKWAPIPICRKGSQMPKGAKSWTFPVSIPGYAACEECYARHILPLLESASAPTILKELTQDTPPMGFVCDLYSPRLQQWFRDVCASYNLETYKKRLMEREAKMQEFNLKLDQLRLQHQQLDRQAQMFRIQQQTAHSMEMARALQFSTSAYYAPPVDFGRSTAAMNQSHQALLQAEMVKENMNMVRREWAELYE